MRNRGSTGKAVRLTQGLAEHDAGGDSDVDRPHAFDHRDRQPLVRKGVYRVGHTGRFPSHQQDIGIAERAAGISFFRFCGQQNQTPVCSTTPILEGVEGDVALERRTLQVIHSRPLQGAVGQRKTGRFDQMNANTQAGGQT